MALDRDRRQEHAEKAVRSGLRVDDQRIAPDPTQAGKMRQRPLVHRGGIDARTLPATQSPPDAGKLLAQQQMVVLARGIPAAAQPLIPGCGLVMPGDHHQRLRIRTEGGRLQAQLTLLGQPGQVTDSIRHQLVEWLSRQPPRRRKDRQGSEPFASGEGDQFGERQHRRGTMRCARRGQPT